MLSQLKKLFQGSTNIRNLETSIDQLDSDLKFKYKEARNLNIQIENQQATIDKLTNEVNEQTDKVYALESRILNSTDEIQSRDVEITRLRESIGHMLHFMHYCKQVVDGFVAAADRLPDQCGLDSELARSILQDFEMVQQSKVRLEKQRVLLDLIKSRSYVIKRDTEPLNPDIIKDPIEETDIIQAIEKEHFKVINSEITVDGESIKNIKEIGLFTALITVGELKGEINVWIVPTE